MQKTAEFVSLGHPDKTSDYISSYILDRMIEQDPAVKYAVEVMLKGNNVILGGEVTGNVDLSHIHQYVLNALAEVGYNQNYAKIWKNYALEPDKIKVINLIGQQSADINIGVKQNGWGDQGVFVGYACKGDKAINRELYLAQKLNDTLYAKAKETDSRLGLDIKTQITLDDNGAIETAIVAIPMLEN
ncbi:MAG: methionine adenosyltransferase, partial [Alphaproteobacteria bacterium]|nr:methionine adenosyltransferase [Alphaproteobacteria bacterium]